MRNVAIAVWLECVYGAYKRDQHKLNELLRDMQREEFALHYEHLFPFAVGFGLPLSRFVS